jgi:hypothetical protein
MDLALTLMSFDGVNSATEAFFAARDRPDAPPDAHLRWGWLNITRMATSCYEALSRATTSTSTRPLHISEAPSCLRAWNHGGRGHRRGDRHPAGRPASAPRLA